jgi:hypothetical protein
MMAPHCFALASRKLTFFFTWRKLTVKQALSNGRWMRELQRINSEEQRDQFVSLWAVLQQVNLQNGNRDTIS